MQINGAFYNQWHLRINKTADASLELSFLCVMKIKFQAAQQLSPPPSPTQTRAPLEAAKAGQCFLILSLHVPIPPFLSDLGLEDSVEEQTPGFPELL